MDGARTRVRRRRSSAATATPRCKGGASVRTVLHRRQRRRQHFAEDGLPESIDGGANNGKARMDFGIGSAEVHREADFEAAEAPTTDVDQSITDDGLTTCLSMPSSFGSSPRARPSSWGRCRTGMFSGRPTTPAASGCCRSRFRWHSGHGVTRLSASASIASPRWRPACLQRVLLVHRDDREAAALVLAGVVDDGAAQRLDQQLQVRVARVLVVDAQPVGRAHDVAAVERADAQVRQRPLDLRLDTSRPISSTSSHRKCLLVMPFSYVSPSADSVSLTWSRYGVLRVQALLALALRALAGRADVHHQVGALGDLLLGERERAGVERVRELLVVLGDHAGAAAGGAVELDELDVQQRRDLRHRAVQLRGEAAAHAAGPVGDFHSVRGSRWRARAPSSSPTTYRFSS